LLHHQVLQRQHLPDAILHPQKKKKDTLLLAHLISVLFLFLQHLPAAILHPLMSMQVSVFELLY
jgi:hypothetical protein